MQQLWIGFVFILFNWSLFIHAKPFHRGSANETLLVGQISGPPGGAARNLLGLILSMSVLLNNTQLHNSLIPITNSTFPLNYSIALNDRDFKLENTSSFHIVSTIWQPAYIFEEHVHLLENDTDRLNFEMRTIKFVIIRGEIVHDKHNKGYDLPARHVKLELVGERGHIIDQVDFICTSTNYPCPFEYWLDTSHIKPNIDYRLEAILANSTLPARRTNHSIHQTITSIVAKSNQGTTFRINPTIDTEINGYKIVVSDA